MVLGLKPPTEKCSKQEIEGYGHHISESIRVIKTQVLLQWPHIYGEMMKTSTVYDRTETKSTTLSEGF